MRTMEEPKTLTPEEKLTASLAEADFKLDLWDEPPSMWAVVSKDGELVSEWLAFIPEIWEIAPVHMVLHSLASATLAAKAAGIPSPAERVGGTFVGLIFRTEGWGVKGRNDKGGEPDAPLIEDLEKWMAEGHGLSEHPDRIEVKIYQLLTADGNRSLSLDRGGEPDGVWATDFNGRVPDALREVFDAFVTTSSS